VRGARLVRTQRRRLLLGLLPRNRAQQQEGGFQFHRRLRGGAGQWHGCSGVQQRGEKRRIQALTGGKRAEGLEGRPGAVRVLRPRPRSARAALRGGRGRSVQTLYGRGNVQIRSTGTLSSTAANRAVSPLTVTARPNEPPKFGSTEISLMNLPPTVNSTISLG